MSWDRRGLVFKLKRLRSQSPANYCFMRQSFIAMTDALACHIIQKVAKYHWRCLFSAAQSRVVIAEIIARGESSYTSGDVSGGRVRVS